MENLTKLHSNHCPIMLRCGGGDANVSNMPFRFQAAWIFHDNFHNVVLDARSHGVGNVVDGLVKNLANSVVGKTEAISHGIEEELGRSFNGEYDEQ
ncbi:hypothetical protein Lal_00039797 [Lupinus albus]|nr:hypothetical protein Lal_00039797 [Lupinus albus]